MQNKSLLSYSYTTKVCHQVLNKVKNYLEYYTHSEYRLGAGLGMGGFVIM